MQIYCAPHYILTRQGALPSLLREGQEQMGERKGSGSRPGSRPSFFPNTDALAFSRDLSNNKISSLSNSSFTNMSQLTTL